MLGYILFIVFMIVAANTKDSNYMIASSIFLFSGVIGSSMIEIKKHVANYVMTYHVRNNIDYTSVLSSTDGKKVKAVNLDKPLFTTPNFEIDSWIKCTDKLPHVDYGYESNLLLFKLRTGTVYSGYYGSGGKQRDSYFRPINDSKEGWDSSDVESWREIPK